MNKMFLAMVSILAGLAAGLISAQVMMDRAVMSPADGAQGVAANWHRVAIVSDTGSAFYAAGNFLRKGQLPPPRSARFYTRNMDDEGHSLRGGCVVAIEGKLPDVRWWSIKVEAAGATSSIDAGGAIREADGTLLVSIASAPVPGNWLKAPDDGAYDLDLVFFDPVLPSRTAPPALPTVKRLWC